MAQAAFSEDGNYYSAITQDGRLRIWDTETNALKQEYTPDLHLTSSPSCLQWISVTQSAGPSQKGGRRKSSTSEQEIQCIALGTTSGKVLIYSVAQAKVETVLTEEESKMQRCKVTCLDWHRKYGLYSCNKANYVHDWDLQSGAVRNKYNINVDNRNKQVNSVSAIQIIPHSKKTPARFLVTASWQVRVWRLHNGDAEIIKCLGHSASTTALLSVAAINNMCWLVEGSQTERLLSFWDVTITDDHIPQLNGEDTTPNKKKRKRSTVEAPTVPSPTYHFVLEDAPRLLDVNIKEEDGGTRLCLAAATRSGVVHYYGHMLNGASTKPIKPTVTVQVTTPDAQPLPLQCCQLPSTGDLLIGYSHGPTVLFEKITPDLKSKTQVLIRGEAKGGKKKNNQTNEVNKVRGDRGADDVTYVEPMGGVSRKRATPGAKVEVPMEERLANLTVDSKGRSKSAVNQNLTKLLMQGLHSKDRRLILTVLQHREAGVATRTVSALPAEYVPKLLEQLADMATRKTSQCASVCTWLGATLRCHSALLLATSSAPTSQHLTQLLAILTHRRSHLCQLLNLKGRLELTTAQRDAGAAEPDPQPVLDYDDTSSEEEMEVEKVLSGSETSEHSWREGGDHSGGEASDSGGED